MYLTYFGRSFHEIKMVHSSRSRKVTVQYDDVFKLYTRVLGAVAIPLLILSQLLEKIMRNHMAGVYYEKLLGKKVHKGLYEYLFLGNIDHQISNEEKAFARKSRDIKTI